MKKLLMVCLLAVLSVSGSVSCVNAQTKSDNSAQASTSGASKDVVTVCEIFNKAIATIEKDPSKMNEVGETLGNGVKDLNTDQKLTTADKNLLKQTFHRLMKAVVVSQMDANPQMASLMANMTDEQKQQTIDMAMQIAAKEIDGKIDACETLGDLAKMTSDM